MFKRLSGNDLRGKNDIIQTFIKNFSLPMFYKHGENSKFITNSAFDIFMGSNRQKVLNQLLSLNSSKQNKFELELTNDIGKKIESITYISDIGKDNEAKLGIIVDISEQVNAKKTINTFKERYELATKGSNEGLWDFDINSGVVFYSNRFKEIIGYANKPIKNNISSWLDTIVPEDKIRVAKALEDHINARTENFATEHRIKINNQIRWVSIRGKVSRNKNRKPLRIVGFITDITEIKKAQIALKDSQEQFQLFMENLPAGAFIRDENNNFIFSNRYLNDFFGVDTLEGQNIEDIINLNENQSFISNQELISKGTFTCEEKLSDKNGAKHYFQTHRFIIDKNDKKLFGGIYSDISEQKKTEIKLNIMAHYDLLTNLPNRALFQDTLRNAISKAKRAKSKIALMFLDLDNFKMINDTLGHDYGDLLLIEVAKRLKTILRAEDTVSRLGGDEFTIILEDIGETTYPSIVAQKIIDALSQPIQLGDEMGYIGASVGIAIFPDDANEIEPLIKNADLAMYTAKNGGKNIYKYFTEDMNADATERLELSNDLRNAISNNQLKLYYQPIVNTKSNTLEAFEALVRWEHPKYGVITPDNFIKLAEEGGFMAKVGKWILERSCNQIKLMQNSGLKIKITVNISSKQITQNHLEQTVIEVVKKSGINATLLELEVTENFLMENINKVEQVLTNLKKIGINTAIDDFGTGYSSLGRLKKLPVTKLKIDKSFIDDIPANKDDMQIATTIITLAHQLSLEVVAEGVETQSQADFLKSKGCYLMQGYHFSEAISEDKINIYLKEMGAVTV